MHNKDKSWLEAQCRGAYNLKQEVHLCIARDRPSLIWEKFIHCQVKANKTYSERSISLVSKLGCYEYPIHSKVVVHSKICCVRLKFVVAFACLLLLIVDWCQFVMLIFSQIIGLQAIQEVC